MADKTKDNIDFRKKRVRRIKKVIIVLCILLFILPVVLSIVLFFRVKNLENRIETIISENKLESGGKMQMWTWIHFLTERADGEGGFYEV